MKDKKIKIEVIDKRANNVYFVSEDYKIKYKKKLISLKDLKKEGKQIKKLIYQEDGTIDILYTENNKI
ncbi:MAG: hypothetical protein ACFFAQ_14070 [Promethearchaeota archaeon]